MPSPTQAPAVPVCAIPRRGASVAVGPVAEATTGTDAADRAAMGPAVPARSVTDPAASVRISVPAPLPDAVTVYGPAPDPVTPVTDHDPAAAPSAKSDASTPVTGRLNDTFQVSEVALAVAGTARMSVAAGPSGRAAR